MRISILAVGSRGDVQPALALGVGLQRAGYQVRIGSYAQFADLTAEYGLEFAPIAGDIMQLLQSERGRATLESRNPARLLMLIRDYIGREAEQSRHDIAAACAGAEALISVGQFYYAVEMMATLNRVPHLTAQLQPNLATGAFPSPMLPAPPVHSAPINRASHEFAEWLFYQMLRSTLNQARAAFGLAPAGWRSPLNTGILGGKTALYAFSRILVPQPADWPPATQITGFWFLDPPHAYTPPADLLRFLKAGEPPVYIGFGSMNTRDPQRTAELVFRALELSGRRGVLMRGWGGLDGSHLPAGVHMIDGAPHAWLFPQMAAVVHHGGAGTTGAGLRSGVPSIVVPFFIDQPFWADRVAGLGVGPAPLPRRKLNADNLARALDVIAAPEIRRRAAAVGYLIESETAFSERSSGSPKNCR